MSQDATCEGSPSIIIERSPVNFSPLALEVDASIG
jgi:hypothetical protein